MAGERLVCDIETAGFVLDTSTIWCAVTFNLDTKEYIEYRPHEIKKLIKNLEEASLIVGHNWIMFDQLYLKKHYGYKPKAEVIDTLLYAKLIYYDKDKGWSHSLDAYGERLGEKKGSYSDWSKFTEEMLVYNKQDVEVTKKLYTHLKRKGTWLPQAALQLEQDVQEAVAEQYWKGWRFDEEKARELHITLMVEKEEAAETLYKTFTPTYLPDGKVKVPKRAFRRNNVSTVGPHQPIKYTVFNPGSGKHIVHWVQSLYGKQDWILTDKGNPKTDGDTLLEMFGEKEWAQPLLHYLEVNKLLGQLAEGPKAWMRHMRGDRIHGSADILGAVTGRFTHSNPNLAQVPSTRAYKGSEARSLFTVKDGYNLVGADASGLELRTLSHYLSRYDDGKYGRTVLEGDIHTANQEAAGLPTRDMAKTFIYGFLYGAGDAKIGQITGGGSREGSQLKKRFLAKTEGLPELIRDVKQAAKKKYLRGISGRRLFIRSPHSALNVLLQSAGAYYMKYWIVYVEKMIQDKGYDAQVVGQIHDEGQFEVAKEDVEKFTQDLKESFIIVGEQINMRLKMEGDVAYGLNWCDTH